MCGRLFSTLLSETKVSMRRKENEVTLQCVGVQTIQNFFESISEKVTSGCSKVWVQKESNGSLCFIVGKERIRITVPQEGGII